MASGEDEENTLAKNGDGRRKDLFLTWRTFKLLLQEEFMVAWSSRSFYKGSQRKSDLLILVVMSCLTGVRRTELSPPKEEYVFLTLSHLSNLRPSFFKIQPVLPRFSAKLTWASEEGDRSQDTSGVTPFQMTFQVNENPRSLMTDCLIIKRFLRKIIIVHHKLKFNLTVNGILSAEIFGAEKEPILRLSNGITLVVGFQHYVSKPKLNSTESHCSRIHPVLGHPAPLSIPDGMANMGLLGKLALTPAAALCPSPKVFSRQRDRISSVSIFLYGPLGLPLISDQEQPSITVFRDPSYFIDWKKHNLFMVPTLDLNLDTDLVIPDVNYQVESSEGNQSQDMDSEGPALLLFLFVDFHSRFPVQQAEVWGLHTLLTAHLGATLAESRSTVQESIQSAVDQVLERHHQAAQAHQRLQGSLSVAVKAITSVLTGSTCSSFRNTCLQALEAADTQEFGTKLHRLFYDTIQGRLLHHCACNTEQHPTPEKKHSTQSTEDWHGTIGQQSHAESSGQAENKKLKRSPSLGREESQTLCPARDPSPPECATRHHEPTVASPNARGSPARAAPAPDAASPAGGLEDLWLQEVSNLSEWLSPGRRF
ncbi:type 2 DNA topoisomerase 6 subunit B-like isoform X5 [Arvicola amphibius]|uniref:type 2 DNA topoisomerase 6 subunit B-like isoform X5 n=1 Tax=Arvicola amphibius TaxID=1047088 RepID=UPI0018E295B3|nr:type 2 DNA topoisomerase 6 subunit B-like isoform X5 [Arvicola amphibius]